MSVMFTILSPAKKLDFSRPLLDVETTQPVLMEDATILMSVVRDLSPEQMNQKRLQEKSLKKPERIS